MSDDINSWPVKGTDSMNHGHNKETMDGTATLDRCRCCPYGYHIDLDFVRFCEILSNGQYLQRLKQLHRNRRRQRKSMEAIMGYRDAETMQPKYSDEVLPVSPTDLAIDENCSELDDAMLAFEETLRKSGPGPVTVPSLGVAVSDPRSDNCDSEASSPGAVPDGGNMSAIDGPRSRSDSASSGSSISVPTSCASSAIVLPSQQMADTMAVLASTMNSKGQSSSASGHQPTGVDASVLQSIRDRMALSLQRVKELEEHTKAVPVLQVKLSVLKEEKRLLTLQLKAKSTTSGAMATATATRSIGVGDFPLFEDEREIAERERRLDELGVYATMTRRPRGKYLFADGCIAGCHMRSRSMSPGKKSTVNPEEFHSFLLFHGPRAAANSVQPRTAATRSIGVGRKCTTRDVGVCHVPSPTKDVGVSCCPEILLSTNICTTRDIGVGGLRTDFSSVAVNTDQPRRRALSMTVNRGEDIEPHLCEKCERSRSKITRNQSTATDPVPVVSPRASPVQKQRDRSGDTSDLLHFSDAVVQSVVEVRSSASQTSVETKAVVSCRNAKVGTAVKVEDASVSVIANVRDVGVGGLSIECPHCSGKDLRSVGVGRSSLREPVYCDRCESLDASAVRKRSVGCGSHCVNDKIFCDRCTGVSTTSIAVSTDGLPVVPADPALASAIHVCDKCNKTIRSVATGVVQPTKRSFGSGGMEWLRTWQLPETRSNYKEGSFERKLESGAAVRQLGRKEKGLKSAIGTEKGVSVSGANVETKTDVVTTMKEMRISRDYANSSGSSSSSSSSSSGDSPDEGSYDGLCGKIVHSCKDDEAIRRGLPGATMFQPILEAPQVAFSMSDDLAKACRAVSDYLTSGNQAVSNDFNASLNLVQQEWFVTSSQKTANPQFVEGFLDSLEATSPQLLNKIVNSSDINGNTAMHYAISHANFDVVGILLDSKVCDVNKTNKAGYTSVMLASLAKQKDDSHNSVLQRLFRMGDVNIKATQHGQTALMLAVSRGRSDVVRMLLDAGADVNIKDKDGSTALMCAAEHGHMNIVKLLLAHADCDPNIMDNDGSTALSIAMEAGYKDVGVLIYAHTSFSRGSSPYASLKLKRRGSGTPTRLASTPPPRTPPPPSPAWSRKSAALMP